MSYNILIDAVYHLVCQGRRVDWPREGELRKSNKEAAQTRKAIVAATADHIRRTGIAQSSLADVMAAAGLTHGGFYRHFRSKEHLVTEALSAAGDKATAAIGRNIAKGGINAAVDAYLSTSHRDSPAPICPFAALGSEMARSGSETKSAVTEVLEKLFSTFADSGSGTDTRGDAIVALSTMIGAMTLARITSGTPLSEEILNRAKDHLRR
jgi:TetR/AcrR family transcriptional regulator, transcriptional repressor for nem operon